jgi:predicted membrane-bound spermidine synthase
MTAGALEDTRLSIVYENTFLFIRSNKTDFDAVFLDFPRPTDYGVSIIYSVELYSMVRSALSEKGFAVMDMPDGESNDKASLYPTYTNTVKAAGFPTVIPLLFKLEDEHSSITNLHYNILGIYFPY